MITLDLIGSITLTPFILDKRFNVTLSFEPSLTIITSQFFQVGFWTEDSSIFHQNYNMV